MAKLVDVLCHFCEKKISVESYRTKRTKRFFCSRDCQFKWQKTDEYSLIHQSRKKKSDIKIVCAYCGKVSYKKKRNVKGKNSFCDKYCRNKYNAEKIKKEMTKDKVKVKCDNCGRDKYVNESVFKKNKNFFCSRDCYWQWRRHNIPKGKDSPFYNRIEKKCDNCEKEIEVTPFVDKRNNYFFCSQKCYYKWNINKSFVINPKTKPQMMLNKILDELNIKYNNEFFCEGYFIDNVLYVENKMYFIECNGTFWHGDNRKFNTLHHSIQLKGVLRDKTKNLIIKKMYNIDILYLWEDDILNNQNLCKMLILEYVQNKGLIDNYHSFNYEIENNKLKLKNEIIIPYMNYSKQELKKIINF